MSCIGECAQGHQFTKTWMFLTKEDLEVVSVTDSSSCRAFTQRMGVGRMKDLDVSFFFKMVSGKTKAGTLEL